MKTYSVTLWTTAGHSLKTLVVAGNMEEAEQRARMIRSEYILQPTRVEVHSR